jgi:hypothetical protein
MAGVIRTADVSAAEGFDLWQHVISSTFVPVECRPLSREPFHGEVVTSDLGDL